MQITGIFKMPVAVVRKQIIFFQVDIYIQGFPKKIIL